MRGFLRYGGAVILAFLLASLPVSAFGADALYRFMHNDHDALVIGEITAIDESTVTVTAADYIVSAMDLRAGEPIEQQRPETLRIPADAGWRLSEFAVGDLLIVSVNHKIGDDFDVAWGVYAVDSTDYRTLTVQPYPGASGLSTSTAMLTDFVNSGGAYTEYVTDAGKVYRRSDGEDTLIFGHEDVSAGGEEETPVNTGASEAAWAKAEAVLAAAEEAAMAADTTVSVSAVNAAGQRPFPMLAAGSIFTLGVAGVAIVKLRQNKAGNTR